MKEDSQTTTSTPSKAPVAIRGIGSWWRGVSTQLGLNSLRGRYLYAAFAFVLFLVAAGWLTQRQVNEATGFGLAHTAERNKVMTHVFALEDRIWTAQKSLQDYLLVPRPHLIDSVDRALENAQSSAQALAAIRWVQGNAKARDHIEQLKFNLSRLQQETRKVMTVRTDPERLFPAMPTMIEKMLPAYTDFYTAATLAMDEAKEQPKDPRQTQIHLLFSDARHAATLMIGDFRNWVANRFGVFGEAESAMRSQASNLRLHAEMVERHLEKLTKFENAGQLGFQQGISLEKMRALHKNWMKHYRQVYAIYTSDHWRADTPLMRDIVQPLFANTWDVRRKLDEELEHYSGQDVSLLTQAADRTTTAIWLLAGIAIVVICLGYLYFEYTVHRPIARVASALKAEASGAGEVDLPATLTLETQDLTSAFADMREQVHTRQQRLETILNNAAEGIITFDEHGVIEGFNHAAQSLFGWTEPEVLGTDMTHLLVPDVREQRKDYLRHFMRTELRRLIGHEGEVRGRHKDGSNFPMAIKISSMMLEDRQLYVALVSDISERKAMLDHLKNMAEHDGLTGLYNRTYFNDELERVVERTRRSKSLTCAVLYIDLDNFKYVNDTLGHAAGDHLLIEVAGILHRRARRSDLIARFGGDEFTVLLFNTIPEMAEQVAESFRKQLVDYQFKFEGEHIDVGCSIGVALIDQKTQSPAEAMSQADLACHLAKRGGRNRVHKFNPEDADKVATMSLDMGWSRRIKDAIDNGKFALACQPIINTHTRNIEAFEVLIRMLDENNEQIMPAGFLPTAERFGLAVDIDKWVIVNAIETLVDQRVSLPELRYSINLSGQTLSDLSVCELIDQKLKETGLDPAALTFEVTETVAIADMAAAETFLSRLKAIGCKTALDDFGSGMSSFAYLKDLPVDSVKIDGRFVKNMATNPVDEAMVKAMNDIAHALGKETVAEFVENAESFQKLKDHGVDFCQGYYLGRPEVTFPCRAIGEKSGLALVCQAR